MGTLEGDRFPELLYLDFIETHCELGLECCVTILDICDAITTSKGNVDTAFKGAFADAVSCLTHASMVAGFLFEKGARNKAARRRKVVRCPHVRGLLAVSTPALEALGVRDALIHVDERIDQIWDSWPGTKAMIRHDRSGINVVMEEAEIPFFVLDAPNRTISVFEASARVDKISAELKAIMDAIPFAHRRLSEPEFIPLWRKLPRADHDALGE